MTFKTEDTRAAPSILVGGFQIAVLQSVSSSRGGVIGADLQRDLKLRLDRDEIHMPQVYAALQRLERLGMISSVKDEHASAGRRGRTRRVYKIEAPGLRMMEAGEMLSSPAVPIAV